MIADVVGTVLFLTAVWVYGWHYRRRHPDEHIRSDRFDGWSP